MKGKLIFVVGLATGYVLGTRAGRERYEQIRSGWLSVWHTAPVQRQVDKAQDFAKARVSELPGIVGRGVGSLITAVSGGKTPGEKVDRTLAAARRSVDEAAEGVDRAAAGEPAKKPAAKKTAAKKPAAKKTAAKKPAAKKASGGSTSSTSK